jgi:ferredoxin--NADP+ reductase
MKIIDKSVIAGQKGVAITKFIIQAPQIARKVSPGEFVVLMVSEAGERFPLTVVDADASGGTITLIAQEAGLSTQLLGGLKAGDSLYTLVGPLGHATEIKNYGRVVVIGGGVGIAEIYPVAKALKKCGNHLSVILGSRSKDLLILEDELKSISDEFYITTDDGSYGQKGFVTDILKELLTTYDMRHTIYGLVYAVGPIPMMKAVAGMTRPSGIKTIVSLNALMVDATGMCGSCRVTVNGEVKFACVDGPEFDAHGVDWEELAKRSKVYEDKEQHICKLNEI